MCQELVTAGDLYDISPSLEHLPTCTVEGTESVCVSIAELAKAKKQRKQAAKQEAIASGMHQLKATGKGSKSGRGHGKARIAKKQK